MFYFKTTKKNSQKILQTYKTKKLTKGQVKGKHAYKTAKKTKKKIDHFG